VVALSERIERFDVVILRTPRGKSSLPVMRVVIGGVASRHALPVDRLDDLELAVETLFREEPLQGGDLTLSVSVEAERFRVTLGGLRSELVRRTLSAGEDHEREKDGRSDVLLMLMDSLVDGYRAEDGLPSGSFSVEMEKRIS
jgi:hypothetical protein